ncbi:MAG: hypothetical protein JWQ72_2826, partial [Polaromonas sp.]|nr:hypothetical protein [Polaromonas sp.]
AGDTTEPRFHPNEDWLRHASPVEQKTAMWRWFATRYEELEPSTPHDREGNYFFGRQEPVLVDEVLRQRFAQLVPAEVLDALLHRVQAKAGNQWVVMDLDKLSS